MSEKTPDVRRVGGKFVTLRRIYRDKESGFGRVLVSAEGKAVSAALVEELGLTVDEVPAAKPNKKRGPQAKK